MLLHPEGQPDQAALHLRPALSDAVQLLHAAFVKIRLVRHLDDVAGAQRIAPPEGDHNLHARLRNAPEPLGNAVGKGAVHIFMRNIHDDVCVFSLHLLYRLLSVLYEEKEIPRSFRISAISSRSSIGCFTPRIS